MYVYVDLKAVEEWQGDKLIGLTDIQPANDNVNHYDLYELGYRIPKRFAREVEKAFVCSDEAGIKAFIEEMLNEDNVEYHVQVTQDNVVYFVVERENKE